MHSSVATKGQLGALGEHIACRYLTGKGYKIVEMNYSNSKGYRLGEIDIIATQKNQLVFVEVKTEMVPEGGEDHLEERITVEKLRKLDRIASEYRRKKKAEQMEYRFDAVLVSYDAQAKKARVRHIEHLFL